VALAHVLSLTEPKASNRRIILVSDIITPQLVANLIRKNFLQLYDKTVVGNPQCILPMGVKPTGWDTSQSFDIFGERWEYRGLEESLVDTATSILDLEKKWGL
jgi:hypothetical protein